MAGQTPADMVHVDAGKGLRAVVRCLTANQGTVAAAAAAAQKLASTAGTAAEAAGKAAVAAAAEARTAGSDAGATAQALADTRRELATLTGATKDLDAAVKSLAARQPRVATAVVVPAVAVVVTPVAQDLALTWSTPWPDTSYTVLPWTETAPALLGKVAVLVKSKTKEGCVVTVTTTAVLTSTAATLRAIAVAS